MPDLVHQVEELLAKLQETRSSVEDEIQGGLDLGERLREAARSVGQSSAGSWAGWHSRMYYNDYQEPPVEDTWDAEWGGLHRYSAEWQGRTLKEVQGVIESRSGVTLADLAASADRVRETCETLHAEVVSVLSPICDLSGLEREGELVGKIEEMEWITSPGKFVRALAPQQVVTRDSGALSQGLQAPLHLEVEAAIVSNTSTLTTAREFLARAIRLSRQVETKLRAAGPPSADGAMTSGEPSELARQLRRRSSALFFVLGVLVVGASYWAMARWLESSLLEAVVIVGAAIAIAGLYAMLLGSAHVWRILSIAAVVGGAIAAVQQVLDR